MSAFTMPEFLKNHSVEDIHNRMKEVLPSDIDMSEGGHAWNLTIVTALVAAELCEFVLPEVIKVVFPQWSYGAFLDEHGKARGITRRAATAATGYLKFTGTPGTKIPLGSLFTTVAVNEEASMDYETLEEKEIPTAGVVTVKAQCKELGEKGNAGADTIILSGSKITGLLSVTNAEAFIGGTEEETDQALAERIADYDKSQGESFTGCIADYKRWAKTVPGVGDAVILPAQDDTGLVTIILSDANGKPATESLCQAVYNRIMSPDDPMMRLAPINALLSVIPPETVSIGVKATVEQEDGATLAGIKSEFIQTITGYLALALAEKEVKLTKVGAILAETTGVKDYKNLQIGVKTNGVITFNASNITLQQNQLPEIKEENLSFTLGTV